MSLDGLYVIFGTNHTKICNFSIKRLHKIYWCSSTFRMFILTWHWSQLIPIQTQMLAADSEWATVAVSNCRWATVGGATVGWATIMVSKCRVSNCQGEQLSRWANVEVSNCDSEQLSKWANVAVSNWRVSNCRVSNCQWATIMVSNCRVSNCHGFFFD